MVDSMKNKIDALFIPFFADIDRWHNDSDSDMTHESIANQKNAAHKGVRKARMLSEGVMVDDRAYDLSRFLSWVAYGTTNEYERYDSYTLTLLSGCYYTSLLSRHGYNVYSANTVNRSSLQILADKVDPRFVLLSTTLILEHMVLRDCISYLRRLWPDAIVILGGLFLVELQKTNSREQLIELLNFYNADIYLITPYGEAPLLEILKRGTRKKLLEQPAIPSAFFLNGGEVQGPPADVKEEIMPLAQNYIRWSRHVPPGHLYHCVHMRTARSCAFKCAFCNFPINQGPLTMLPLQTVEDELTELSLCRKVDSIIFTDDTFNVPQKRFLQLCRLISRFNFSWYSFFRPQFGSREVAQLMKSAHCKAVFVGIESTDNTILKNMNKKTTIEDMKRGVEELKKLGFIFMQILLLVFRGKPKEPWMVLVSF